LPVLDVGVLLGGAAGAPARQGDGALVVEIDGLACALRVDQVDHVASLYEAGGEVKDAAGRPLVLLEPERLVPASAGAGDGGGRARDMTDGEVDFDPEELAMLRQLFRSEAHEALEAMTARCWRRGRWGRRRGADRDDAGDAHAEGRGGDGGAAGDGGSGASAGERAGGVWPRPVALDGRDGGGAGRGDRRAADLSGHEDDPGAGQMADELRTSIEQLALPQPNRRAGTQPPVAIEPVAGDAAGDAGPGAEPGRRRTRDRWWSPGRGCGSSPRGSTR